MELDSWQLQGFGDSQISPNISVFTNLMVDHQNYYANDMGRYFADKANIFVSQKENDSLVCGKGVLILMRKKYSSFAKRAIVPDANVVPKNWKIKLLGEHNRQNIAYAVTVARILDIKESVIKKVVENYAGVAGRLEFAREVDGIKYYNDTTATTPDGVIAALEALSGPTSPRLRGVTKPNIVLVGGGRDKELEYKKYAPVVKKNVKALALFAGSASDKIVSALGRTKMPVKVFDNMKEAFAWSRSQAKRGDIVLLSPGAASFGVFKNEYDRGDQFVDQIKKIKP
jgi:UDP-N-acetylmuramoylalanine--D-glutamate ligase